VIVIGTNVLTGMKMFFLISFVEWLPQANPKNPGTNLFLYLPA
jgi:hypothetical protein